jgi:hypothetical protein
MVGPRSFKDLASLAVRPCDGLVSESPFPAEKSAHGAGVLEADARQQAGIRHTPMCRTTLPEAEQVLYGSSSQCCKEACRDPQ